MQAELKTWRSAGSREGATSDFETVAVLSGTAVEPLNVSRTFAAKTEAEAKAGTEKGFGDAARCIFFQVWRNWEAPCWAVCTGRDNKVD